MIPALAQLQDPLCEHLVLPNTSDLFSWQVGKRYYSNCPQVRRAWERASIDTLCNVILICHNLDPKSFWQCGFGLYRLMAFVDATGFFLGKGHVWSKWLLHQSLRFCRIERTCQTVKPSNLLHLRSSLSLAGRRTPENKSLSMAIVSWPSAEAKTSIQRCIILLLQGHRDGTRTCKNM